MPSSNSATGFRADSQRDGILFCSGDVVMPNLKTIASGQFGEISLSLSNVLLRLHQRGRLVPLLRETVVEHLLLHQAERAGLAVSVVELQQAADAFRRRHGLASAEQTYAWLAGQRLTMDDLEGVLERDLL